MTWGSVFADRALERPLRDGGHFEDMPETDEITFAKSPKFSFFLRASLRLC